MNLEHLDQELNHWRERLSLAAENLRAFVDLPAYQWVAGGAATGQTATRLTPIAGVMNDLQSYLGILTATINRAEELRGTVTRLMPLSETMREIEELLEGTSINLASGPTPLEQRELLRPIQTTQAITPRELLESMLESFRLLRDVVLDVDAARGEAGAKIGCLEQQLTDMQISGGQGILPSDLTEVNSRISAFKKLADSDPLEAVSQAQVVGAYLESVRERTAIVAAQQKLTGTRLAEARQTLEKLVQVHERACRLDAERVFKVEEDHLPAMSDSAAMESMTVWLGKLEQTALEGKWGPASIGIDRWRQEAERRLAADEAVIRTAEAALNRRRDLRGLLDALTAKAQMLRRADDPELSALAAQAFEMLGRRPTPMERARKVVKEYETRLL